MIFFFLCYQKQVVIPQIEPSQLDGSTEGSQYLFCVEIWKIVPKYRYPCYPFLSKYKLCTGFSYIMVCLPVRGDIP